MVWMNKQSVYAVKAKRIVIVLLLLSVFAIAFTIVEYPSQGEISTQPLIDAGVSPLKVRPGDAMLITASCVDPAGIETVTADMGGIETIQLSLISGTICDGTWQATWLVHDTEVRDYNTTVTATNVFGESSSVNIGWSDPATSGMGAYGESGATAASGVSRLFAVPPQSYYGLARHRLRRQRRRLPALFPDGSPGSLPCRRGTGQEKTQAENTW